MKVTLVTAYFQPEISPITHLYADLAADLAHYGAEVTVVTGQPDRGLDEETWRAYLDRREETTPEGYRILRVGGKGREGHKLLRRGWRLLTQTGVLERAARRTGADVYLLGSMPPMLGNVGARLAKGQKARTVYILQDIFPDTLVRMGRFREKHPVIRLARAMEKRAYAGNSHFVTLSGDMKKNLVAKGVAPEKITVIPNWADTDEVHPLDREANKLFEELGLDRSAFYALYAGVLGKLQDPDVLLDAAKLLLPEKGITLLILGGGAMEQHVRRRMESEHLVNVKLLPLQPPERVSEVYSLGNVALVPLRKGVTQCAMPSKTWTAMAAGVPVIAGAEPGSDWAEVIGRSGGGTCVPPEDGQALAEAIRAAYAARETLPETGRWGRAYLEKEWTRAKATEAYYHVCTGEGEQEHV